MSTRLLFIFTSLVAHLQEVAKTGYSVNLVTVTFVSLYSQHCGCLQSCEPLGLILRDYLALFFN